MDIEFPQSSYVNPPHRVEGPMKEARESFYELAKSRIKMMTAEEFSKWVRDAVGESKLENGVALNMFWSKLKKEGSITVEKLIENCEIGINKDAFVIDDKSYLDIMPFIVEHELYEAWLNAKKGLMADAFEQEDLMKKHLLAERKEFLLAEQAGLAEKLFEFRMKIMPENEEEHRSALKYARNKRIEKKERPQIVYHSSHNPDIEEFTPQDERVRDSEEGPVIFATPSRALASAFLVEGHNDDWTQIGFYDNIPVVVICSDREEFIKKDKGGTLYSLPSETFDFDPTSGMRESEWTSRSNVKPTGKTSYPSALDAMIENGVNVFFVDQKTFSEINEAEDNGASILLKLVSENKLRGQDTKRLKEILAGGTEK